MTKNLKLKLIETPDTSQCMIQEDSEDKTFQLFSISVPKDIGARIVACVDACDGIENTDVIKELAASIRNRASRISIKDRFDTLMFEGRYSEARSLVVKLSNLANAAKDIMDFLPTFTDAKNLAELNEGRSLTGILPAIKFREALAALEEE